MKKLLIYMKGYWREAVIAPLFKMLEASFELLVPLVMAKIIDVGIRTQDVGYIWRMCALMIFLGVLGLTCSLTAQYFAAKSSMGFGTALREALFAHINQFSYSELDVIGTPTLVTRMTSDINQAQAGVNLVLRLFLRSPFIVVGAVFMAMTISVRLTVIFLVAVPLISLAIFLIVKITIPLYRKVQNTLDQVVRHTRENYVGARVVRAFSRQASETEQFEASSRELKGIQLQAGRISALMNPITYVLVNLAIIAILQAGSYSVDGGEITQGELTALINYMSQILLALVALAYLIITVTRATASALRINEVFLHEPSMREGSLSETITAGNEAAMKAGEAAPKVAFRDVTFSYPGAQEPALSHISFTAMAGETIGIIGGTGSGKSTLVNLIPRFYDAASGQVAVDGQDVKDYTFAGLRRKIGMVPQKAVLFLGTIRQNMCWRVPEASEEEIWEALTLAQAREVVEGKPQGLEARVLAGGKNFSGGQRQRLTIARALTGRPEILVLDDSASALDFATDAALRRALKQGTKDMTVFLVSQRAATVREADKILVLDDGELVGQGTHRELLESCPVYREICLSQFSKEEVEGL